MLAELVLALVLGVDAGHVSARGAAVPVPVPLHASEGSAKTEIDDDGCPSQALIFMTDTGEDTSSYFRSPP